LDPSILTSLQCLVHTWFLSADFQLHFLAYPLIAIYQSSETLGIFVNLALILFGGILPSYLIYQRNSPPTLSGFIEVILEHFYEDQKHLYYPVWNHLSCYFVGTLVAFLLFKSQKDFEDFKGSKLRRIHSWILFIKTTSALTLSIASVLSAWLWTRESGPLVGNPTLGVIYFGFHRLVFILGPAWIVYACIRFLRSKFRFPRSQIDVFFVLSILG